MTATSHGRSGRPWRRIREQVLTRDPYCTIRGPRCTGVSTQVDHIVPLSVDPSRAHDLTNLRGACAACNAAGGARITNRRNAVPVRRPPEQERQTYRGPGRCPVSNHGSICSGGHLMPLSQWRPEYGQPATWPDGEFMPGAR